MNEDAQMILNMNYSQHVNNENQNSNSDEESTPLSELPDGGYIEFV